MNDFRTKTILFCAITLATGFVPVRNVQGQVLFDGCSPAYWQDHTAEWLATGFLPGQSVKSVFSKASIYRMAKESLLQAVMSQGSDGEISYSRYHRHRVSNAARTLISAAVAALLNSAHPGLDFLRTTTQVIDEVNAALASRDRDIILELAGTLDFLDDTFKCPLSNNN